MTLAFGEIKPMMRSYVVNEIVRVSTYIFHIGCNILDCKIIHITKMGRCLQSTQCIYDHCFVKFYLYYMYRVYRHNNVSMIRTLLP